MPNDSPVASSVQGFEGPQGEPCVMWGSEGTGSQQIKAIYDNWRPSPSITYYWNEYCVSGDGCFDLNGESTTDPPLQLVKEWNDIDSTTIVGVTGDLGSQPSPT